MSDISKLYYKSRYKRRYNVGDTDTNPQQRPLAKFVFTRIKPTDKPPRLLHEIKCRENEGENEKLADKETQYSHT